MARSRQETSQGPVDKSGRVWETGDLGTAAYAHMRGLPILGVRRGQGGGSRFMFMFEDPEEQGAEFQVDYLNSESRRFDAAVRSLKKLCYDSGSSR